MEDNPSMYRGLTPDKLFTIATQEKDAEAAATLSRMALGSQDPYPRQLVQSLDQMNITFEHPGLQSKKRVVFTSRFPFFQRV